jgi:hypothetical protein
MHAAVGPLLTFLMKTTLRVLLLIFLILVLVAYVGAQYFLGSMVKAGVNQAGPRLTQSTVQLEDASLSPLSGSGSLTGLTVGNPKGWSDARAIYLGKMQFDIEPTSVLGDTVVVNDLVIDQPEFTYETRLVASNIGDLMKNIEAAMGPKAEPEKEQTKPRKFIVKHFRMQNAKVTLGIGAAAVPLSLPPLELSDLGVKEGGLTSTQLTVAVMKQVLPEIISAATKGAGNIGGAVGDAVKQASEGLQKMLGGKKE